MFEVSAAKIYCALVLGALSLVAISYIADIVFDSVQLVFGAVIAGMFVSWPLGRLSKSFDDFITTMIICVAISIGVVLGISMWGIGGGDIAHKDYVVIEKQEPTRYRPFSLDIKNDTNVINKYVDSETWDEAQVGGPLVLKVHKSVFGFDTIIGYQLQRPTSNQKTVTDN